MKNNNQEQPWLDKHGNALSDEVLKIVSKVWDQDTWGRYLDHYCGQKIDESKEALIEDSARLEDLLNNSSEPTFLNGGDYSNLRLKSRLMKALRTLSDLQKFTIEKIFFEGWTDSEVAEKLNVSPQTIFNHKSRAIAHLENNTNVLSEFLRLVKRQNKIRPRRKRRG